MKPSVSRWVKELPEGAVPVRARTDESSLIWTSPEDAADQKPLTVCWVGPTKRGFWQTLLGSALARGTWMEVPVFPQSPRPAKPTTTVKKKSWADVEVKAGRRLRIEPYDPDARDGDNDGIVQEGTAWERPAGTRLLDEAGKEIERGLTATSRASGLRVVDRDGKDVPFTPSYGAKKPAAGRGRISRAPQLGVTIGDQMEQTGRRRPAVPEGARAAEEIRKPSLLDPKGVREARKKGLLRGLPEDPRGWPPRLPWTPGDTSEIRRNSPDLEGSRQRQIDQFRSGQVAQIVQELQALRGFTRVDDGPRDSLLAAIDALIDEFGSEEALAEHLFDMTLARHRATVAEIRDQPMIISMRPEALVQLLNDGRYRTQFETGRSGGAYDPAHRRAVEQRFGVPNSPDVDVIRPTYGSLVPLDGKHVSKTGPVNYEALPGASYGGAQIVLRERVRGRTTMTFGDSFGRQWGLPLTGQITDDQIITTHSPEISRQQTWLHRDRHAAFAELLATKGYLTEDATAYRLSAQATLGAIGVPADRLDDYGFPRLGGDLPTHPDPIGATNDRYSSFYMETQIHGGVTLHDVAEIRIIEERTADETRSKLEEQAEALGIKIVWVKDSDPVTNLPRR